MLDIKTCTGGRSPLPPHKTRLPRFLQPTTIALFIGQTRSPLMAGERRSPYNLVKAQSSFG
ncbi:MAG: hypothetical protein AB4042_01415 [Leptolyngbyaceae cyanobacterium]